MAAQEMSGELFTDTGKAQKEDSQSEANPHPIFCQDPGQWVNYIHKTVCVTTSDGGSHSGRVYTIDPVSQSVVLAAVTDDDHTVSSVKVIMGHAVDKITELDSEALSDKGIKVFEGLFKQHQEGVHSGVSVSEQRDKVKSWLLKNKIPVSVTVDSSGNECLNISDALLIIPPYSPENCQCANEIMLGKVQTLIRNMPKSFG